MNENQTSALQPYLRHRLETKPILLMTHLVVGYPSIKANWEMLESMESAGVDMVELQMPFSEPVADGPYFVKANHDAVQSGVTWDDYFELATRASRQFSFPIIFMGYYNSVFRMGNKRFCERLSAAGIKGFILPDLPPEEAVALNSLAREFGLDPILVMTPMSSVSRLAEIGRQSSGFVYCAARKGVTGRQTELSQDVAAITDRYRAATSLPLGLGFGIKTANDVRDTRGLADIAIVGTAGLEAWQTQGPEGYQRFLNSLVEATK